MKFWQDKIFKKWPLPSLISFIHIIEEYKILQILFSSNALPVKEAHYKFVINNVFPFLVPIQLAIPHSHEAAVFTTPFVLVCCSLLIPTY